MTNPAVHSASNKRLKATPLSDEFLSTLVAALNNDDIVGITLGGSYARDEATPYSDVDIACFVPDASKLQPKRFLYQNGHLVSIATKAITDVRSDLAKPERAIRFVPGLNVDRTRHILLDKDGSVSQLLQDIANLRWESLQEAANKYASFGMMVLAEDAHKILSELLKDNDLGLAYATSKLLSGLTETVAVQRGVMVKNDSTYYRQVHEAAELDSDWARYHRIAAGIDPGNRDVSPIEARGVACLGLYQETAKLLEPILQPEHRKVVEQTVQVIDRAGLSGWLQEDSVGE